MLCRAITTSTARANSVSPSSYSGALAARRSSKRSLILIWERKGNPSMNFLMYIMASGIARGRVRTDHDGDDGDGVAQDGGHTPNNRLTETCSLGLITVYFFDIGHLCYDQLIPVKTRYLLTVSRNHIAGSSVQLIEVTCFLKLTADQVLFSIGLQAHVRLTC